MVTGNAAWPRCARPSSLARPGSPSIRGVVISRIVFTGGTVWSGTAGRADALAVEDGLVVAVGAAAGRLVGDADEVVDLTGGLLLPSFGDGHAHPVFGGLEAQGPRVKEQRSVDDIVAEVRRWAEEHPDREWIVTGSYDPSLAPDGEFDARWLDAAVADRPVVLRAYDYHTVWCNTEALRRAGVDETTPDPSLGTIVRRADGTPMGTLREWHACDLVLDRAPVAEPSSYAEALAEAGRQYAAAGVTWVQDAWVDDDLVDVYLTAARDGTLPLRFNLGLRADPEMWEHQRITFAANRRAVEAVDHPLLTARTVKFFADGVIEGGTAALLEPYADAPHSHGMPVWSADELAAAVTAFDADGFQVHIHAIGDAGVRNALDAVAAARRTNADWDRRPVIAHTQLVEPSDIARFAELGVIANFEPLWAQLDPLMNVLTRPRLGDVRTDLQYPMAQLRDSGARLSFGSDWPVSSLHPLEGIQIGVTRRTFDGEPHEGWTPHQRLALDEALTTYTAGVAYQAFGDDTWGTLDVGRSADLVWLGADPFAVDPLAVKDIPVRGTWLRGARV